MLDSLADCAPNPHIARRGLALVCFFATYTRMADEDDIATGTLLEDEEEVGEGELLPEAEEKEEW